MKISQLYSNRNCSIISLVLLTLILFSAYQKNVTTMSETQPQKIHGSDVQKKVVGSFQLASKRFVCCSDTHGLHNSKTLTLPEGDVLLFAGDAGIDDNHEVERFESWLGSLPYEHKVVVMGNMDSAAAQPKDNRESEVSHSKGGHHGGGCITLRNASVAHDKIIEVEGYRILGSPWTPAFYGQWQLDSSELAKQHWESLLPPDANVDIIMTHGPPYGYGDESRGRHVGDKALLKAVQNLKRAPLLWVCGHIHESYGQHRVPHPLAPNGILLINAAVNNLRGGDLNAAPRAVDLPEGTVHGPTVQRNRHLIAEKSIWKAVTDFLI